MSVPDHNLISKISDFLSESGICCDSMEIASPEDDASPFCFRFDRRVNDQLFAMRVVGEPELRRVTVYAKHPFTISSRKRRRVAEFITRVNYGMSMATLEMDFSDGEVRCRSEIAYDGGDLTYSQLRTLLYCSAVTMTTVLPAIERVALGELNPKEADKHVRNQIG